MENDNALDSQLSFENFRNLSPAQMWIKRHLLLTVAIFCFMVGAIYFLTRPTEELLGTYASPDHSCTLRTYRVNGGATVDFSVKGIVTYEKNYWCRWPREIYSQYHCSSATVSWLNSQTVNINGTLLEVEHDR